MDNNTENQGANALKNDSSAPNTMEEILNRNNSTCNIPNFPGSFVSNLSDKGNTDIPKMPNAFNVDKATDTKVTEAPLGSNNPFVLNKNTKELAINAENNSDVKEEVKDSAKDTESTNKADSAVTNEKVEETSSSEDKTEDTVKEEKKTKTRRRKKDKNVEEQTTEHVEDYEIPTSEVDYSEIVDIVSPHFAEKDWDNFEKDITERMKKVTISNNMGTVALKQVIATLDELRDAVWPHMAYIKYLYENLTDKEDGILTRVKRINSYGSNDNERKNNACKAIMNYKVNDKNINLYELLDETRRRYYFLDYLMRTIQYKSNSVISTLANLKLEK